MFRELGMNLREYSSNNSFLIEEMASQDKSSDLSSKVLGTTWNTQTDQWEIACCIKPHSRVTKRTVASTMAAIYDPLGWIIL